MIEHYLQRKIMATLVENKSARFAELRPKDTDSNLFAYHLHALVSQKLVVKDPLGNYALTAKGKLSGINLSLGREERLLQAHSVIFVVLRDGNTWLLRRRLVHPMHGKIGFIHGEPAAGKSAVEAAKQILKRRTNLEATLTARGNGFITLRTEKEIESFIHFVIFEGTNYSGELIEADNHGENLWLPNPSFNAEDMIASMKDIAHLLQVDGGHFFIDKEY